MNKDVAYKDILRNLREKNLAIFAGAGLSAKAGFVSWSELMKPIAEELDLKIEDETDYVALAQYHENEFKTRSKINQLLIDELSSNAIITKNHQILSRLPISTYWTTNYDKLIETSLEKNGKVPDVKYTVKQLALTRSKRDAVVYKMHGDIEHPSEAIITRDDYESYYIKMEPYLSALAGDLVSKTFLFIGFSFTDPNLDYILSRVRLTYKKNQRRHYCFMRKIKEELCKSTLEFEYREKKFKLFIKDLQRFSVETILIDDFEEITEFLANLEREINRDTVFISGAAHNYGAWDKEIAENFISYVPELCNDEKS